MASERADVIARPDLQRAVEDPSRERVLRKSNDPRIPKLRSIFNCFDPIGLIEIGCPLDEYDPEIAEILPAVSECKNVADLSVLMRSVFARMFDEEMAACFPDWDKLADEIWKTFVH